MDRPPRVLPETRREVSAEGGLPKLFRLLVDFLRMPKLPAAGRYYNSMYQYCFQSLSRRPGVEFRWPGRSRRNYYKYGLTRSCKAIKIQFTATFNHCGANNNYLSKMIAYPGNSGVSRCGLSFSNSVKGTKIWGIFGAIG